MKRIMLVVITSWFSFLVLSLVVNVGRSGAPFILAWLLALASCFMLVNLWHLVVVVITKKTMTLHSLIRTLLGRSPCCGAKVIKFTPVDCIGFYEICERCRYVVNDKLIN